jgi:TonB family protein
MPDVCPAVPTTPPSSLPFALSTLPPALHVQALFGDLVVDSRVLLRPRTDAAPSVYGVGSSRAAAAPADRALLADELHELVRFGPGGAAVTLAPAMTGEVLFDGGAPTVPVPLSGGDTDRVRRFLTTHLIPPAPAPPPPAAPGGPRGAGAPTAGGPDRPAPPAPRAAAARPGAPRSSLIARPVPVAPSRAAIERAGILGVLRARQGQTWAALLEEGSALTGMGPDVLAGLIGGGTEGAGGPAVTGTGFGGQGVGESTLGGGGLRTLGRLGGGPGGARYGRSAGGLDPRGPRVALHLQVTNPVVRGGLDKELVRREIRRHLNEIRYCYERALVTRPDLAGRVVVQFSVAAEGAVIAAAIAQSTLGAAGVEACVTQAVRRWTFPRSPQGGLTVVNYPFVFAAAGAP